MPNTPGCAKARGAITTTQRKTTARDVIVSSSRQVLYRQRMVAYLDPSIDGVLEKGGIGRRRARMGAVI